MPHQGEVINLSQGFHGLLCLQSSIQCFAENYSTENIKWGKKTFQAVINILTEFGA